MIKKLLASILVFALTLNPARAAIDHDGTDDYISAADSSSLDVSTAFSLSYWFYRPASGDKIHLAKWQEGARSYVLQIFSDNTVYFFVSGDCSATPFISSNSTYAISGWHHLAGTYSGGTTTVKFYLDGVEIAGTVSGTIPGSACNGTAPFGSIYNLTSTPQYIKGYLDDIRLYNRVLTAAEIQTIYDSKLRGTYIGEGIISYWTVNDGEAGTSADGDRIVDHFGGNHMTGNDGAGNTGLSWIGASPLSYPPTIQ